MSPCSSTPCAFRRARRNSALPLLPTGTAALPTLPALRLSLRRSGSKPLCYCYDYDYYYYYYYCYCYYYYYHYYYYYYYYF